MALTRSLSVTLNDAQIAVSLQLDGAHVDRALNASRIRVGSTFFARSGDAGCERPKASFGELILKRARIVLNIEMNGASVQGDLDGEGLQVGGDIYLQSRGREPGEGGCTLPAVESTFSKVDLHFATIGGYLDAGRIDIDGGWDGKGLQVGGDLDMGLSTFREAVVLAAARLGGHLDLRRAHLSGLDLSGAAIVGLLQLGDTEGEGGHATTWTRNLGVPEILIVDARVGSLMDASGSCPQLGNLHLDGFSFGHLGGEGGSGAEMRGRGADWWDRWARLDETFVPAAYDQLAAAFAAAGERDRADDIRFKARLRQMEHEDWPSWAGSALLLSFAGFGIWNRTFWVLYWVAGLSLAVAAYLWTSVPSARSQGTAWCLGASLSRLLPGIEVSKEFSDFFDDPTAARLSRRQSLGFAAFGLFGWFVGFILVAAVSGLFPKG